MGRPSPEWAFRRNDFDVSGVPHVDNVALSARTVGTMIRLSIVFFAASVLFGLVGLIGAADDPDFFNPDDFRDTGQLHHEHLVLLAGLAAFLMLVAAGVTFLWELRTYTPPPYDAEPRERV